MHWRFGKRLHGIVAAVSLIIGFGGIYEDAKTWGGWLTSNPYITGGCFGIAFVCGVLYIISRWDKFFRTIWRFLLQKVMRLDKHAMSILRKEEPRLDELRKEVSRCYQDKNYRSHNLIDTLLELHATGELLDILGVPSPETTGKQTNMSDDDLLLKWMVFIRALLTRIRHGEMSDVRSTLEDIDYPDDNTSQQNC